MSDYPTATICGTMRLFPQMLTVADELTRQGYIVLMPLTRKLAGHEVPLATHMRVRELELQDGRTYDHGASHLNATPISNEELDRMHRAKILRADLVVVVTDFTRYIMSSDSRELYFGESTTAEMDYAHRLVKPIRLARVKRYEYRDTIIWLDDVDARDEVVQGTDG